MTLPSSLCSVTEAAFTILMILLGLVVYSIVIGAASSAIQNGDSESAQQRAQLDRIRAFLRARNVPRFFQHIVTEYYEHAWACELQK